MHVAQSDFARGQVRLTVDYRTNSGARRVELLFTGDDIGPRSEEQEQSPAREEALRLLSEFIGAASGDLKANRVHWHGI